MFQADMFKFILLNAPTETLSIMNVVYKYVTFFIQMHKIKHIAFYVYESNKLNM